MSGWFARMLSQGGKEILLKVVAMAMPVFAMSCFKLSKTTCDKLSSVMADFWWDTSEERRKMHWIGWNKVCLPKEYRGLGFKDIQVFNQALLAKQVWRLVHEKNCLFASFIRSRYFEGGVFLDAVLCSRLSYAWRSILHGRDLLVIGLRHMVGDGRSLNVWSTPWLCDGRMRAPFMKNILINIDLKVGDLINYEERKWDRDKLHEHFFPKDIYLILKIKPVCDADDFFCWNHTKSGVYSVKTGYWLAFQQANEEILRDAAMLPSLNGIKDLIWDLKAPPKIKTFLWKAISDAIPVVDKIISRGIKIDSRCQTCGLEGETANHVLFLCTLARQVIEGRDLVRGAANNCLRASWKLPPLGWAKCNIGVSWNKKNQEGGASWVLRDDKGFVLIHGQRSFARIKSHFEVTLASCLWASERMKSLRWNFLVFAMEDKDLVGAVNRPPAWPSLRPYSQVLLLALDNFLDWSFLFEHKLANEGASLIAHSVTRENRWQSYMSLGDPCWLKSLFTAETRVAAL